MIHTISTKDLNTLKLVACAASQDKLRPSLNALYINQNGIAHATDGYSLLKANKPIDGLVDAYLPTDLITKAKPKDYIQVERLPGQMKVTKISSNGMTNGQILELDGFSWPKEQVNQLLNKEYITIPSNFALGKHTLDMMARVSKFNKFGYSIKLTSRGILDPIKIEVFDGRDILATGLVMPVKLLSN